MKSNEYLYGDEEPPEVPAYVCMRRIEILKDRLAEELEKDYMDRSTVKIMDLEKAIRHWEKINDL